MVLAVRKYLRNPDHWGRRLLLMTDSLVAIGTGMKGRSGSTPLLNQLRVLAGNLLAAGCMLYLRRIPGWRNLADGPSRGRPIGTGAKALGPRVRVQPGGASELAGAVRVDLPPALAEHLDRGRLTS